MTITSLDFNWLNSLAALRKNINLELHISKVRSRHYLIEVVKRSVAFERGIISIVEGPQPDLIAFNFHARKIMPSGGMFLYYSAPIQKIEVTKYHRLRTL